MERGAAVSRVCVSVTLRRGEMSSVKIILAVNLTLPSFRHRTYTHVCPHIHKHLPSFQEIPLPNLFNTLESRLNQNLIKHAQAVRIG